VDEQLADADYNRRQFLILFTFSITVPANTAKTNPVKKTIKLRAGTITKISVLIPTGHCALAHLAIYHGETQIMPWGEDQYIEGDGETIDWTPDYQLPSEPATLEVRAWNEDDTYQHTFYLRIWIKKVKAQPNWPLIEEAATTIKRLVKRLIG